MCPGHFWICKFGMVPGIMCFVSLHLAEVRALQLDSVGSRRPSYTRFFEKKIKKSRKKNILVFQRPQRIR